MARRGCVWTRNKMITAAELEAMTDELNSRPESDCVECRFGRADSPYVFYYGIAWKTSNLDGADDYDEED